jgi:hypothetical protein
MPQKFIDSFNQYLLDHYPSLKERSFSISENLISPHIFQLKREYLDQARLVAAATYKLRTLSTYQDYVRSKNQNAAANFDPGNFSLFMSYDFHLTEDGLKLIEINTNAAFSLVVYELHKFAGLTPENSFYADYHIQLQEAFRNEARLSLSKSQPDMIAIVDESPQAQKMFVEFVMFQDLFTKWNWKSGIYDENEFSFSGNALSSSDGMKVDFVYYRSTDFMIDGSPELRAAYLNRGACFSPNPHEYALLADKSRLIDFKNLDLLRQLGLDEDSVQAIDKHVPFIRETKSLQADELWELRKKTVFKPKNAYAGKEVYRGANITRKVFDHVRDGDFVAQEFVPAPIIMIKREAGRKEEFKYDLRFYAYRDQIQLVTARLYQGQVTNFRAPGSGFTAIELV